MDFGPATSQQLVSNST